MNANYQFSQNPVNIDIQRSTFGMSQNYKTTFNTGDLIPLHISEILPGDTISDAHIAGVVRMATPVYPVMDNAWLDVYSFFVPNRILWEHWKNFQGENTESAWISDTEYEIPQLKAPSGGWNNGSLMDYFGIPTQVGDISVNALPVRAYCMIWNEWFRDQNLQQPVAVNLDDTTQSGSNDKSDMVINAQLGAAPLKAAKAHDYFTSALPSPQKGPDVPLPLGNLAPVLTQASYITPADVSVQAGQPLYWASTTFTQPAPDSQYKYLALYGDNVVGDDDEISGTYTYSQFGGSATSDTAVQPVNLWADLSLATGTSINALRQAFAVQRIFERDARGGTRYREILKAHFGVTSPDATQQVPEFISGYRIPINVDQVTQTSSTDETSPLGQTGAYSLTAGDVQFPIKSFTEHGYFMILGVVRYSHSYQQGINKLWSRLNRFDFYMPALANIGEQPIFNKEIYATGTDTDNEVFGYQEAWAEYRYLPNLITGQFRSNFSQPLDMWHYGDYYTSQPVLSAEWIQEDPSNVARTIAVTDQNYPQFIGDFQFLAKFTRPMPLRSIPGLLDHN